MNHFSTEEIEEALKASGTGVWRLESEEGKPIRFYGDSLMNSLIGVSDDTTPEDRFSIFMSRVHKEDLSIFMAYYDRLKQNEKSEVVYRYMHPEKGIMYVRCDGKRDFSVKEFNCYRGCHQNINETVRIEQKERQILTAKAELYQKLSYKIMQNTSDAALYLNLDNGQYEWIDLKNESLKEQNTYQDICARIANNSILPEYREEYLENTSLANLKKQLENKDNYSFSTYVRGSENELRRLTFWYYTVDDRHSEVLSLSKDTTEEYLKEIELADALMQAKQANRSKTVFLNNMSHDMRTPMNAIIGFTSLAEKYIDDKERCTDYLNKIMVSSEHLLSLINDVLDMSRIESGKMEVKETECSLKSMLSELKVLMLADASAKELDFSVNMSEIKNDNIFCDKLRLNQILLNCASNAIKFTPVYGKVSISAKQLDDAPKGYGHYEFRIKDTGIGMSEEFLKHIYEPFSRDENKAVHNIQGTGLGMAITKNIIDMLGGTIFINSKPGEGSEFIINLTFELSDNSEIIEDNSIHKSSNFSLKDKKILLAEDNVLNSEIAMEILGEMGAIVDWAENGKETVEMLASSEIGHYDVILMDIQMPKMNGYEATTEIRSLERSDAKTIPIIAMTANAFEEDKQKAIEAGMNDHISKPINISILIDTISKYM